MLIVLSFQSYLHFRYKDYKLHARVNMYVEVQKASAIKASN